MVSETKSARMPSGQTQAAHYFDEPTDEEIYCPVCDYNLTGNLTGRCSECGSLFDRRRLLEASRISVDALMPWERPDVLPLSRRFRRTVGISFFRPKEFALAFAAQPRDTRSTSFLLICLALMLGVAVAITGVLGLAGWFRDARAVAAAAGWAVLLLVLPIVPVNIAVGLIYYRRYAHPDGRRYLRPWRAILEYASAHWLMGAAAPVISLPFAIIGGETADAAIVLWTLGIWVGCSLLWALTLKEVVRWRTVSKIEPGLVFAATVIVTWATWIGTVLLLAIPVEVFD